MTDISWNLKALTDDAQAWTCVSNHLTKASGLLDLATVSQGDFLAFLGNSATAQSATTQAVEGLRALLVDGSERTKHGADVLLEVRDAYQANENQARDTYDGLWEPDDE